MDVFKEANNSTRAFTMLLLAFGIGQILISPARLADEVPASSHNRVVEKCIGDLACIWNNRMLGADLDCP